MAAKPCPSCGALKGITKLSSIMQKGEETELMARLAAPMNPQRGVKNLSSRDFLLFVGLAFVMTAFMLALQSRSFGALVIYGIFMLFFIAGAVRLLLNYWRTRKVAEALTPAWREAALIWNRLYYCRAEDLVFDPRTNQTARPDEYHQVLLHYPPVLPGINAPKEKPAS